WSLYGVIWAALSLAWLDPGMKQSVPVVHYLAVFDLSLSMTVRDMDGRSRLEVAREHFRRVLPTLPPSARLSLGGFVGKTVQIFLLETPPEDLARLEAALDLMDWRNAWDVGSRVDRAIEDIAYQMIEAPLRLLAGPRPGGYVRVLPAPLNVFFFTDGGGSDVRTELPEDVRAWLRRSTRWTFIGVGRPWESQVPDPENPGRCLQDSAGRCFTSRLNEENLRAWAQALEGRYIPLGGGQTLHTYFHEGLRVGETVPVHRRVGWVFALIALGLFLADLGTNSRRGPMNP
ncbi:MAG: VWA domain-containing protein, partial [Acidobacteria bacterium]|nr:VWA domain-containing protein [Acidobacteriota bacterium]MDW7984965.1 VWA domain-containing protein [Acidobacteriota bacterium]